MSEPRRSLTKLLVERTAPQPSRDVFLWDSKLPGFGARIYPSGKRMYIFQYRTKARQQRRVAIGLHGPTFTVEKARQRAGDLYEAVRKGRDPAQEDRTAASRQPDTIERVAEQFIEKYLQQKKRAPSYIHDTRALFDNHVLSKWRNRDIKSIRRRDVIELLDGVVEKGKPIAANRVLAAVRKLFNWALQRDIIEASPVALVAMPSAETKRERTLSANEVRTLWPQFAALGYPFGPFLQMALATGQRREEVAGMRWQDIDEAEGTWTLPSESTKPGRAHIVPLAPLAMDILREARQSAMQLVGQLANDPAGAPKLPEYVFTTRGDRPISGYSKAKARLDDAVARARAEAAARENRKPEPIAPWTIHDLRRTVATGLGKLNVSRFIIGRVLNHADRSVTGIYDRHEYLDEKRRALDAWATYLRNMIAEPAVNVVQLRR
jgi:integrase